MNLSSIAHNLERKDRHVRAVIETPRGGRTKFAYEPKLKAFHANFLLPEGMTFPLDFGFVPSTQAEDGDPVDILVLADEPLPSGSVVDVRLIGGIEAEQSDGKKKPVRNDRLLAVHELSHLHAKVQTLDDLGPQFLDQITSFWENYNELRGRTFKVLNLCPADTAAQLIESHSV